MKQTAVEWFVEEMFKQGYFNDKQLTISNIKHFVKQAKEMEKEQMFSYTKEKQVIGENSMKFFKEDFEQYYNKTYKR